jgi:putative transposase
MTPVLHLLQAAQLGRSQIMYSLPFITCLIAATILARQNKAPLSEVVYLRAEIAFLHSQGPKRKKLVFSDAWRKRLARAAEEIPWQRLEQIATVAKAGTIRSWRRLMGVGKLGVRYAGPGRPRTKLDVEQTVVRLATENPTWGQIRIRGEMMKLGVRLAARTVAAILTRHGLGPAPKRRADPMWRQFVTDHLDCLVATDFFTVDVWGWLGKQSYDVLFAIHVGSRKVEIMGVTQHSDEAYMAQVARNQTIPDTGWLKQVGCRYLIHDRDTKFCGKWKGILQDAGITLVPTPPRSPDLNAFAERWVRTVKTECVRRCWFLGYNGLCRALREYLIHYGEERPHQSMGNQPLTRNPADLPPAQISIADFKAGEIRCVKRCNGAIRHYYRVAA